MLPTTRHAAYVIIFIIYCLIPSAHAVVSRVEIEIHDTTPLHVFPPAKRFSFDVTVTVISGPTPEGLGYQWRDFRGQPLGPIVPLAEGHRTTVASPSSHPPVGYYGLALLPDDNTVMFNKNTGSRKEIGFAVLPARTESDRALDLSSPFGLVHADLNDPHVPTWIKTMTWRTTGARWWGYEMQRRRDKGLQELPLISGDGWTSDDSEQVSPRSIKALKKKIRGYFEADPQIEHWELGREENLRSRFREPHYFTNLKAKAAAVREVAADVNPRMQLLYQVAGRSLSDVQRFLASEAAAEFDILAPHPYAWPDFPMPEEWLESFIDSRRSAMKLAARSMPMWFTEIGAPQNDAGVAQMLSGNAPVRGQARDEHAAYLVKVHTIALASGIEKILWYNYRDRDSSTTDVEDHFGMIDFWGFPKPAYAAYVAMTQCLNGKRYEEKRHLAENVLIYAFSNAHEACLVAWSYPAGTRTVPLSTVLQGLEVHMLTAVTNVVGTPIDAAADITLNEYPIFFRYKR